MADYYETYSFTIDYLTPEEGIWWEAKLDEIGRRNEILHQEDPDHEDIIYLDTAEMLPMSTIFPTCMRFQSDQCDLVIKDLVKILQDFLKENRPNKFIGFSWANSVNTTRVEEFAWGSMASFGGGAVFITATTIEYSNTYDFLDAKCMEFAT